MLLNLITELYKLLVLVLFDQIKFWQQQYVFKSNKRGIEECLFKLLFMELNSELIGGNVQGLDLKTLEVNPF